MGAPRPTAERRIVRLGVMGWPVAHSLSPAMHTAALRSCGLSGWHYGLLPVPPELFVETTRALPGTGFRGVNVTIPHKQAALALADSCTRTAEGVGAANTLLFSADGIQAENTDAPALLAALPFPADGLTALVLGAGGSARAAVWALLNAGAARVGVWNRTAERAEQLALELGADVAVRLFPADLLVNCTASGLRDPAAQLKQLPLTADEIAMFGCVVDFVYANQETELIRSARSRSIPAVDGMELLVGQGALSFERFSGLAAPVNSMRGAVRPRD